MLMWAYAAHSCAILFHESLVHHWGSREGATPSLCWRSRNQEVPCVSLVTFLCEESYRGVERGAPRRRGLLKLKLRAVCQIFSFFLQRKFCGQDMEYVIFLLKREPHQTGYFANVGLRSPPPRYLSFHEERYERRV